MAKKQQKKVSTAKAVALMYDTARDKAPRVAAKGSGEIARKILELAREHNIPIRQDADLLELLAKVDVLDEIPSDLYAAVAEILAFLYDVNQRKLTLASGEEKRNDTRDLHSGSGNGSPTDEIRSNS